MKTFCAASLSLFLAILSAPARGPSESFLWQKFYEAQHAPKKPSVTVPAPTPSPLPRKKSQTPSAESSVSRADIIATVKHLIEINKELQATVEKQKNDLANAATAQTGALDANAKSLGALMALQKQVTKLAAHDKKETDRANKLDKALWWYRLHWWGAWIVFGLGVLACIALAFLKFTGRLAILGTAVAAKIP